ncbi:MAG: hypothetical protein SVX43_17785, partial [Cyanobacteriota bacterium]|nr:hypothetical protein [Cyanobacteriota bacterium]
MTIGSYQIQLKSAIAPPNKASAIASQTNPIDGLSSKSARRYPCQLQATPVTDITEGLLRRDRCLTHPK